MPNKTKSRNNSRKTNTSRNSVDSAPRVEADDDWAGNIVMKSKPSSRNTTPKNKIVVNTPPSPRPEFLEPLSPKPITPPPPPPTPWETLGMTEEDYVAMMGRVRAQMMETMRKNYINNLLADLENPSYWLRRIEQFEKEREYFNQKRGWSAADIAAVERIDEEIQECEDELDRIYANEDRLEVDYD